MDPETIQNSTGEMLEAAVEMISTWGLSVVGAIAVLIIGRIVANVIRNNVRKGLERSGTDAALVPFISSMVYYAVLAVVLIAVLNLFGIETTSLVAVFGAAGLAVGLALQGTLSNFAAGTMLLIFRPIRPGDFVEVAGVAGSVSEIGIFTTSLNTGTPAEDALQKSYHKMPDNWQAQAGAELPAGRLLNMNEVARWIAHLASDESGIMTGSILDFDHGVIGVYEATPLPAKKS